ncbi:MAG: GntR family transcriptional regulator [Erysipelotrichaceae bacterium]|nr:GntR family transcriptional regulator [Erysipelotrichaceae bacterium]
MQKKSKTQTVKDYILSHIESGVYQVGQMIDSELVLADRLQVSRVTVRDAIRDLVEENILEKEHGRGTFVLKQPKFKGFRCGIGFTEEILRNQMHPSAKHVEVIETVADEEVAESLQIPVHSPVWNVSRLRLADDHPVAVEYEFFSKAIVPELTLEAAQSSIYRYIHQFGIDFSYVDQTIDAASANEILADLLEVEIGTPLVRMYIVAHLKNGTPFNCGTTYYRTDHFKLTQTVYQK